MIEPTSVMCFLTGLDYEGIILLIHNADGVQTTTKRKKKTNKTWLETIRNDSKDT